MKSGVEASGPLLVVIERSDGRHLCPSPILDKAPIVVIEAVRYILGRLLLTPESVRA
jgi:hypothetical protein